MAHQAFRAIASSTLPPLHGHTFGAERVAEAHPEVPWAEGAQGPGRGEWIELEAARPAPLTAIGLLPGFQKEGKPHLFFENGRPRQVEILLDGRHRFEATLVDRPGVQIVPVKGWTRPVARIRITLLDIHPGSRWEDTCITRIVLYAEPPGDGQESVGNPRP